VEARVKLNSTWREVRKKIRDDPRFQKYSVDERVRCTLCCVFIMLIIVRQ